MSKSYLSIEAEEWSFTSLEKVFNIFGNLKGKQIKKHNEKFWFKKRERFLSYDDAHGWRHSFNTSRCEHHHQWQFWTFWSKTAVIRQDNNMTEAHIMFVSVLQKMVRPNQWCPTTWGSSYTTMTEDVKYTDAVQMSWGNLSSWRTAWGHHGHNW